MADETTQGQAAPTPTPHPDFTKPPAAQGETRTQAAPAPAPPPSVSLTMEQVQHYMGLERQLADIQAAKQAEVEAAKQAELLAMAKAGDSEKALDEQKRIWQAKEAEALKKYKDLDNQILSEKHEAVVNGALNGVVFVGDTDEQRAAAANLFKLSVTPALETVRLADGSIVTRDKASGRPAAEVLRERLSDPSLAFLFPPKSRGGSGGDGTRPPANPQQPAPGSLEANVAAFKAKQGQYPSFGLHPVT